MQFEHTYKGSTAVANRPGATDMSFAPDLNRQPTFFSGELANCVGFREAISALHDVVVSDLKFQPKDRTEYKQWAAEHEKFDMAMFDAERKEVADQVTALKTEYDELLRRSTERMGPYWAAVSKFRSYVGEKEKDLLWLFDPVITVHPDEVFFECFSRDESTYARLGTGFEVYRNVGEFACGTTNVDYSMGLYREFQKIRSYKTTRLDVDPSGFEVQTDRDESFKEVKIDLPDSWVRGFLQVSSAMGLPTVSFDLAPVDLHNLCFVLRRHRETKGPRSMRFHLDPGRPVRVVFEPWGIEVVCPTSIFEGDTAHEIRVWGRRRLHTLERLIPVAHSFRVHLLGTGMPTFWVADLGDMSFTLGLSGWTANDWASSANFDLMAPRTEVDTTTKERVFSALGETLYEEPGALAARLGLDRGLVLAALGAWTQAGRAVYDLNKRLYRHRELSRDPLPVEQLRFSNPREARAVEFARSGGVSINKDQREAGGRVSVLGSVRDDGKQFDTSLTLDMDDRILQASCSCNWHQQNKLFKGPCEHILAMRLQNARRAV